ncbi:MAG: hypothetical protein JW776_08085 [Candidatus Lokiarchaeota archaeon]|nr:hypothetical protein [Candidatus Lokiarchaeota archaeon]
MSEKAYIRSIERGVSFLKKTMELKNPRRTIKMGRKSVKFLRKAITIAEKIGLRKKIPFIYEYLQQVQATLGANYLELKKHQDAIKIFQHALESNSKSPQNTKQIEIKSLLLAELAKIYANDLGNLKKAEKYANRSLKLGLDKNYNQEDLLDLYLALNSIYLRIGNIDKISKNYRMMVKLAKRDKRKQLKAQIYYTYGKFLHSIKNDAGESRKYLRKSQTLFESLGSHQLCEEVTKFIEENLSPIDSNNHITDNLNPS